MSTRSIIARPTDNGFEGTYCHSDGMPTSMAKNLHAYVVRWGVDKVRETLVDHKPGWSQIWPHPVNDLPDYMREDGFLAAKDGGAQHVVIDDTLVGVAYSTGDMTNTDKTVFEAFAPQYAYVLNDTHVTVMFPVGGGKWESAGILRYQETYTEDDLVKMECGAGFERCYHYAWAHIPEGHPDHEKVTGTRIGMQEWLGLAPLRFDHAVAVLVGEQRLSLTGSGSTGTAQSDSWRALQEAEYRGQKPVRYWWSVARTAEGKDRSIRTARLTKAGHKVEARLVLPATSVAPETIVEPGTVLTR